MPTTDGMCAQEIVELGHKLHALRKLQGMTITQLAECSGVTRRAISQYERGLTTKEPSLMIVIRLAHALRLPPDAAFAPFYAALDRQS